MSEFTLWGLLSKAQDNIQTIEEAIADAISTHNDDPTAHLGTGRSLEVHKINEVLDHPVGSSVTDKKTMTELSISDDFRIFSQWDSTGEVSNDNWPTLKFYVEYDYVNISKISKEF